MSRSLALSKLDALADDNFQWGSMGQFFFGSVENIVGKGENAS